MDYLLALQYMQILQTLWLAHVGLNLAVPGSTIVLAEKDAPLFDNWKFGQGTEIVANDGKMPYSSNVDIDTYTNYRVEPVGYSTRADGAQIPGLFLAEYKAHATIEGLPLAIDGAYVFRVSNFGEGTSLGRIGLSSEVDALWNLFHVMLEGWVTVEGADTFAVANGKTSYAVGMTSQTRDGHQVGLSAAIGANGQVQGLSFGGTVMLPGIPVPVQFRADVTPASEGFSTEPVPGISFTGNTDGTFYMNMDIEVFSGWLRSVTGGR